MGILLVYISKHTRATYVMNACLVAGIIDRRRTVKRRSSRAATGGSWSRRRRDTGPWSARTTAEQSKWRDGRARGLGVAMVECGPAEWFRFLEILAACRRPLRASPAKLV
jgi:hypothetical protein